MAYRSIGTAARNTGSGDIGPVTLPAGHVAGDILVLCVAAADNIVCSVNQGYTSKLVRSGTASVRQEIWWKRDSGSEVAPTVTHAAGNDAVAVILAFSGCVAAGDPFSAASSQANNGSATVTAPTITPGSLEDCIFVGSAGSNIDTTGAPMTQATYSGTNPTYTERGDTQQDIGSQEAALAVATGTSDGTATGSRTSAITSGYPAAQIDNIGAQLSLLLATAASAPAPAYSWPQSGIKLPGYPTLAQPIGPTFPPDRSTFDVVTPLETTRFVNPLSLVMGPGRVFPFPQPTWTPTVAADVNIIATVGILNLTAGTHEFTEQWAPSAGGVLNLAAGTHTFTEQWAPGAGSLSLTAGTPTFTEQWAPSNPAVLNLGAGTHVFTEQWAPTSGILVLGGGPAVVSGVTTTPPGVDSLFFILDRMGAPIARHKALTAVGTGLLASVQGGCTLWTVNINTGAAGAVLKLYDALDGTGTAFAEIDASTKSSHGFGVMCNNGLYYDLSGGNAKVTIGYA